MITDRIAPPPAPVRAPVLERRFDIGRIHPEFLAYAALFLLSVVMHFWQLGYMAMAHDESIHGWMSWKFFSGRGDFACAGGRRSVTYCYDPVYHGPTLYFLTLIGYFLFGVSDATARLPQTLAGIALIPGCYLLRPVLGKRPALIAALLVTLSPSMVYFSRYARHDALVLLFILLLVAGMFRWLQSGGTGNLVLAAAALALAWATHELVFIVIFIGVTFLAFRLFWEWRPRLFMILATVAIVLGVAMAAATAATTGNEVLNNRLDRLLGPAILGGAGALIALMLTRSWPAEPVLIGRLRAAWATRANADPHRRPTLLGNLPPALLWALATFLVVFGLLFSTFLAYPRGFLDGWYQGLKYWWLSQQDYARGGQPWYYYLMLLPIYELLALVFALGGIGLLAYGRRAFPSQYVYPVEDSAPLDHDTHGDGAGAPLEYGHDESNGAALEHDARGDGNGEAVTMVRRVDVESPVHRLFVGFLAYWSVLAFVAFSWAGEKMPWLLIQIALPVTLLAAWTLSRVIGDVPWRAAWRRQGWAVPLLVIATLVLAGVSAYYLSGAGATQAAFRDRLRALPALAMFGAALFGLLTVAANIGGRLVLRLVALTLAGILLLYGVRSLVQVVYLHPDTPVEPLIYTQTTPDVPVIVDDIRRMAINQTRNERSVEDPTGGLSMPITIDSELAWPFQWYLRDFKSVCWADFQKQNCPLDAAVVLVHTPSLNDSNTPAETRDVLAEEYVRTSESLLNWWFPERKPAGSAVRAYKDIGDQGPWAVLSWPFRPSNWPILARFMIYREIPNKIEGRPLEMYVRRDLAPSGGAAAEQAPSITEPLAVEATIGVGQLSGPRGVTTDAAGNLYVADSLNHRIVVFDQDGALLRTVGSQGSGDGQLFEPSGVAVDAAGNLYVADTWNARIAKFAPDGTWIASWGSGRDDFGEGRRATDTKGAPQANADNPLGFYGPRNLLVVDDRLYIADTGNKRIVVTDLDGNFVEQLGTFGSQSGQFHEPIGLGTDQAGRLYVGDTWNGRIQIFARNADGRVDPVPQQTVKVTGWIKDTYNDPYMATTPDGRMLVALAGRKAVGIYSADGTLERRLIGEAPPLTIPKGLAVAGDGAAYVVDGGGQVLRFRLP